MNRFEAERLERARADLVKRYRANAGLFPNGPDGRVWGCEAWYREEDWVIEEGVAVRVNNVPVNSDVNTVIEEGINRAHAERSDRAAYMREYMRRRRARKEEGK